MSAMNNKIKAFTIAIALIFSNSLYAADITDENNICQADGDTVFALFNGVTTPHNTAYTNLLKLKAIHGETSPDGGKVDYDLMYNHTDGYQDFVETFEQRFQEQHEIRDRWELFFQVLKDQGNWWDNILLRVPELVVDADNWKNILQANFIRNLSGLLADPPETMRNIKLRLIVGYLKEKNYYLLLIHKAISLRIMHTPIQQVKYLLNQ